MLILASVLSTATSILIVAIGLGLVIFVHELGHFAVAKWVGVFVERFSMGFGPVLWSFRRGETEYALSAIPFGGYVKMLGQDDFRPEEMVNEEVRLDPRSYPAQSVPKRMAIISAGVIMNVIFGFFLYLLVFNLGAPYTPAVVGNIEPGSPAWVAGVERGDRILSLNGNPIDDFETLRQRVMLSEAKEAIELVTARGDQTHAFRMVPRAGVLAPQIGVGESRALVLAKLKIDGAETAVQPDSAAARATGEQFRPGDRITHVNGEPVRDYADWVDRLERLADQELRVTVTRAADAAKPEVETTATIVVPTSRMREFGFRLQMAEVTAVRVGSPADGKILPGDRIESINGQATLDPLRLADYVWRLRDQDVEIVLTRQAGGTEQSVRVTLRPEDRPPAPVYIEGSPLAVPALGIAFRVGQIVADVTPGSPAYVAGLQKGDRIIQVSAFPSSPKGEKPPEPIKLDESKTPMLPVIFWDLQYDPAMELELLVKRGDDEITTAKFSPAEASDWFSPLRGVVLDLLSERMKPQGFARAMVRGYETTRDTMAIIYLSLRQLISGNLSPKLLSGPVMIARVGYEAASTDYMHFVKFLALLSINLAVINFLPMPVLDGGHMLLLAWEWVRGKPASDRVLIIANYCGLVFILTLAVFVTWQDICNLIR